MLAPGLSAHLRIEFTPLPAPGGSYTRSHSEDMVTLRPRKSPRVSASRVTPRKRSPSPRPSSSQSTATDVVSVISRLTQQIIEMRTELKEEREERRRFEERILAQRDAALEKVDRLERALETMDRKQRSNNVIIFGLPESPGDLGNAVKSLFQPSGSSLSPNVLDVRRLGRPADAGSNARARPRPVLVQFATSAAKHHAFLQQAPAAGEEHHSR
jgi:hypothetical protein